MDIPHKAAGYLIIALVIALIWGASEMWRARRKITGIAKAGARQVERSAARLKAKAGPQD